MVDHVTIRVPDLDDATPLYELGFDAIGFGGTRTSGGGFHQWHDFSIGHATTTHPRTRRLHVGFAAPTPEHVHAVGDALTGAGYGDDGPLGTRPEYAPDDHGAFVLDSAGDNSVGAVHDNSLRSDGGVVDRLWIRVADLDAATRFDETIAHAGHHAHVRPGRSVSPATTAPSPSSPAHPPSTSTSPSLRSTERRERVPSRRHRSRLHTDNGPPGERPIDHPGYDGASVIDSDGHTGRGRRPRANTPHVSRQRS